jgi:hypothetical protein
MSKFIGVDYDEQKTKRKKFPRGKKKTASSPDFFHSGA